MSRTTNVRRVLMVAITVLSLYAASTADAKVEPAKGGRAPCATVSQCRTEAAHLKASIRWQKHDRAQLHWQLARQRVAAPLMDTTYICKIGEVLTGVPTHHCVTVVGCESGGRPKLDEYGGSNGAGGAAQYQPNTWTGTAFSRAGFSLFDPLPAILAMDVYAARHGFNTGGGWAASHHCHGYSGPEA